MRIHVLGLGKSLEEYKPNAEISIGVNDIFSRIETDFIVCIDPPNRFTDQRIETINNSTPVKFFTNRNEWEHVKGYHLITLNPVRGSVKELRSDKICYSNNSPFVACVMAYKLGAKEIVLHGVDFVDHHALSKSEQFSRAMNDFKKLNDELKKYRVKLFVSSKYSTLSEFLPLYR